ncbi:hypothetical protein MJO28_016544 [Puccinia striiformis f. sp. tritici]|uniref:Inhibitor I9 domain-containing protein n=2 Tax=Puccinia striiformis f. sp. tritici TaxID=168172 RepID=A0A0L0VUT7_9BASI|nr:hypothetical protein Pst134EA_030376 [Puccinia striiformis f. sp. tritici]KNF03059.1 hypothetical protein PSTG_03651 [Puccinia striiformis f. sp. tritici PST-78]KAH9440287.1 hypothetical protein Pst134EB_030908 [Puccinia striiformis f. sp. tritici]KAH9446458.1 hypothetical protein Pst134EA_030376 [Puccinia striiformis f. sp. tritici]KAI7934828.1 hypothetical protein MJO29_016091 [Puccinia striiformis f. sp. tritici]KAI7935673.1 hypothetical protein MJO28_016544 [Puccinia striiformis f. sp. 
MSLNSEDQQPTPANQSQEINPPSTLSSSQKSRSSTPQVDLPQQQENEATDEKDTDQSKNLDESHTPDHDRASPEPQEPKAAYIVTLKKETTKEQFEVYKQQLLDQGADIKHEYYSIILKGFAVSLKPTKLQTFQQDPLVTDIEMDQQVHI